MLGTTTAPPLLSLITEPVELAWINGVTSKSGVPLNDDPTHYLLISLVQYWTNYTCGGETIGRDLWLDNDVRKTVCGNATQWTQITKRTTTSFTYSSSNANMGLKIIGYIKIL